MKDNNMTKLLTPPNSPDYHEPSRQSNSASKLRNRNKAKCYRNNEKLKNEITAMERRVTVYRKRWLWIKKTHKLITTKGDTPRSKTRKLLQKSVHSNQK
jgi:hypothetical protein